MDDYQFKLQLKAIFKEAKSSLQAAGFYSIEPSHRKHLIKLIAAGFPALKAIATIKQAAAFAESFPDELKDNYMNSVVELITRIYI